MIVSTWKMLNILDKELDKEETTTAEEKLMKIKT